MPARVMVFAKINRGDEEAFEAAYAAVTANVKGTEGHIADESCAAPSRRIPRMSRARTSCSASGRARKPSSPGRTRRPTPRSETR